MTDKEEKLARDALKYGFIFMLAITMPLWGPIILIGAMFCYPIYLLYLLFDEFSQDDRENKVKN